jgi:hypothetical protein
MSFMTRAERSPVLQPLTQASSPRVTTQKTRFCARSGRGAVGRQTVQIVGSRAGIRVGNEARAGAAAFCDPALGNVVAFGT